MSSKTWFERALFISWYCAVGDCAYCYMSTQKDRISNPKTAIRRKEAVYAEAEICRLCGWKVEFISSGIGCHDIDRIVEMTKEIRRITGQRQWLNIGPVKRSDLLKFGDGLEGVSGAVECVNPEIRQKVCPSKPLSPIIKMLAEAKAIGLKTSITIIVGLGESEDDIPRLIEFIEEHNVDRVTFYSLNPHEGTPFTKGPDTAYYVKWIKAIRERFPGLEIIAGSWVDRLDELHELLLAGADAFTKFPSIRLFNSEFAKKIEEQVKLAGREFEGTMTKVPDEKDLNIEDEKVLAYAKKLLARMRRHSVPVD